MTDEGYPPPRQRRTQARAGGTPPVPMIAGVGLLAVLALVMAFLVFGGNGDDPDASPSPSASASASAAQSASAAASESAAASATPAESGSAGPTPTPVSLEADSIVATAVTDLSVRAAPSTGSTRLGSLELGALSFVAAGPTDAGGYRWYLLSGLGLPPSTGCAGEFQTDPYNCPIWFGWVAAASQDGVPWLTAQAPECPGEPLEIDDLVIGVTDLIRLACFGSDPFTFRGYWPEMSDGDEPDGSCDSEDEPSDWLLCQNLSANRIVVDETQGSDGLGVNVSIDPASGVSMPARGTWVELTVHLDDPAAQGCDEAALAHDGAEPPERYVLFCRGYMVVESVSAVAGP
ncbi:MAG TPA: hypothetical protein VI277_01580 [Candidatus Limnocylindria bacterium]